MVQQEAKNDRQRRGRTQFSHSQLVELKAAFARNNNIKRLELHDLAQRLGLPEKTIRIYFQNQRIKKKKEQQQQQTHFQQHDQQQYQQHSTKLRQEELAHEVSLLSWTSQLQSLELEMRQQQQLALASRIEQVQLMIFQMRSQLATERLYQQGQQFSPPQSPQGLQRSPVACRQPPALLDRSRDRQPQQPKPCVPVPVQQQQQQQQQQQPVCEAKRAYPVDDSQENPPSKRARHCEPAQLPASGHQQQRGTNNDSCVGVFPEGGNGFRLQEVHCVPTVPPQFSPEPQLTVLESSWPKKPALEQQQQQQQQALETEHDFYSNVYPVEDLFFNPDDLLEMIRPDW